jgi:hypothetical protein
LTVSLLVSSTFWAAAPHGTCGAHSTTLSLAFSRSLSAVTLPRLSGGTAISSRLRTKVVGCPDAMWASVTVFMVAGLAAANTSAGAPWVICCARPELPPKLNLTVTPG